MEDVDLAELLGVGGLIFRGWPDAAKPRIPAAVARYAVCCGPESGRTDVKLSYSDEGWQAAANSAWYELAHENRLFADDGTFLVGVALSVDVWPVRGAWASVELSAEWDVAGAGAAGILGGGPYSPEFVMLSVDGEVIVQGTVWQDGIGFLAVPNPRRASVLQKQAEDYAGWELADQSTRQEASDWLRLRGEP